MRCDNFPASCSFGGGEREFRAGVNQIGHGLGLREIEPAVEKSAAREFAGLGQPRTVFQNGVEYQLRRQKCPRDRKF